MSEHARFSPSKMHRIMTCPGSLALESLVQDKTSAYAAEGTAAHELLELCLTDGRGYALAYEGRVFVVEENGQRFEFEADDDMCGYVQEVVDQVRAMIEAAEAYGWTVELLVEQKINTSSVVGIPDQFGTTDIILLARKDGIMRITVGDFKYGRGVPVYAHDEEDGHNPQLMTYGAGVYDLYAVAEDIELITLCIFMPRLGYMSTADVTPEEIEAFKAAAEAAAAQAEIEKGLFDCDKDPASLTLRPAEKACQFCKAKAICPALAGKVQDVVGDFEDLTEKTCEDVKRSALIDTATLSRFMQYTDLVEMWCSAVRARVEAELFAGNTVPGYKLVEGRKGHRKWSDADEAENIMKSMRLKQEAMYTMKLISPAQAEKVLKESEKRWKRLAPLIMQPPGKPSVVAESDKRPALVLPNVADEFEDISESVA